MFKDQSDLLYQNWEQTVNNLIKLRKSILNDTDKLLLDIYQNTGNLSGGNVERLTEIIILNFNVMYFFQDYKHFLMLSLLASLLPCRSRYNLKKKDKEQWKPTVAESREGLIIRVDVSYFLMVCNVCEPITVIATLSLFCRQTMLLGLSLSDKILRAIITLTVKRLFNRLGIYEAKMCMPCAIYYFICI